jgi:hypothetical protein
MQLPPPLYQNLLAMGIRRNILHSYSLIFIFLLLAMAKLVNFNEILNKFIDFFMLEN